LNGTERADSGTHKSYHCAFKRVTLRSWFIAGPGKSPPLLTADLPSLRRPARAGLTQGHFFERSLVSIGHYVRESIYNPDLCGGLAISGVLLRRRGPGTVPWTPKRPPHGSLQDPGEAKPSLVAEKACNFLLLSVPRPLRLGQPFFSHPCPSPEHILVVSSQGKRRRSRPSI
jgi:hypothetical protein